VGQQLYKGGVEPTITDAKLLTGVINPKNFASGQFDLRKDLAEKAISKIAKGLGVDLITAASSIVRIAEANMINALKLVSIQRGHDPRDFVLVAGGGGGAMHAASMGKELGVSEIIVPPYPGYFSAWGMLATNPKADFAITTLLRSDKNNYQDIKDIFKKLEEEAVKYFNTNSDVEKNKINFEKRIDMRYFGQEHTVTIFLNNEIDLKEIIDKFHAEHKRAYTFSLDNTSIEFVTFRLTAYSFSPKPEITELSNKNKLEDAFVEKRNVNFGEEGEFCVNVYSRDNLPKNVKIIGPIVIEEDSTVTVVLPNQEYL
jgi:N-methylhydantoinase A/acetone carboxylase, beta subunit